MNSLSNETLKRGDTTETTKKIKGVQLIISKERRFYLLYIETQEKVDTCDEYVLTPQGYEITDEVDLKDCLALSCDVEMFGPIIIIMSRVWYF